MATKGFTAIKEEAEREAERRAKRQESQDKKMNYISWKDGETKILRFITDDVVSIGMHDYVPTKLGTKQSFVCSRQLDTPRPCHICDNIVDKEGKSLWPSKVILGLAAERKMLPSKKKGVPGEIVDVVGEDGLPVVGLVKQKDGNFWKYATRYYARYGTTIDRDYEVERTGGGLETDYTFTPFDVDQDFREEEVIQAHYADGLAKIPSIDDWIESQGSVGKYEYFFDMGSEEAMEPAAQDKEAWNNSSRLSPAPTVGDEEPPFELDSQTASAAESKPQDTRSLAERLKDFSSSVPRKSEIPGW